MSAGISGLLHILHRFSPCLIGSSGNGPHSFGKVPCGFFLWGIYSISDREGFFFPFEAHDISLFKNVHTDFPLGFLVVKFGLFTCHCGYLVE